MTEFMKPTPGAHESAGWLSEMMASALRRDPVDAINDAEQLLKLLQRGDLRAEAAILSDAGCSFWLQRALHSSRGREPSVALSDAAQLFSLLSHRVIKLLDDHAASRCS